MNPAPQEGYPQSESTEFNVPAGKSVPLMDRFCRDASAWSRRDVFHPLTTRRTPGDRTASGVFPRCQQQGCHGVFSSSSGTGHIGPRSVLYKHDIGGHVQIGGPV